MQLNVPKLFAIQEGADEASEKEDREVGRKFSQFLTDFINRNDLKFSIFIQMTSLLTTISEEDGDYFQHLILSVLDKEVIPEFKVPQGLQTVVSENFHIVLQGVVSTLCKDLTWIKAPTMKQKFCWGLVASCCSNFNIARDNIHRVHSYSTILKQLGYIFNIYCCEKKLTESQCMIVNKLPKDIATHPSEYIRRYFEWVREIQTLMEEWKDKLMHQMANYDEILLYGSNHTNFHLLGITMRVSSLVCNAQDTDQMKTHFHTQFEALNIALIKYIPNQPDMKWCTLPALLQEYGVFLPSNLQEMISKYVLFPGDKKPLGWEALANAVPPNTTGQFQPGHNVCLQLSKNVSLYELEELITTLIYFQRPLLCHLEMLVFFNLHGSVMFDKYLRVQISHNTENLGVELPVTLFIYSLKNTRQLLSKVMQGDAQYSEIIAEGALDLNSLDAKKEFSLLVEYSNMIHLPCTGLSGVQSMLELFQYSTHVNNIDSVCTQYQLKGCLDDPKLAKLKGLIGELVSSEDARAKLTPNEALKKMEAVKITLGITENTKIKSLNLFSSVQNSGAFYQFILDNRFYGTIGIDKFKQQYELISDQLQYEEYNEEVMLHLFDAFKLMTPFMEPRQELETLVSKVLALDVTNEHGQLETVNANITLIRSWFSRVTEMVDSLKREKEELLEMYQKLQTEMEMVLDQNIELKLKKKSLDEENQSLKDNVEVLNQDKDSLLQCNCSLQEKSTSLHQQVLKLQNENRHLHHAQQESMAFGIEPWKLSRDNVKDIIDVIGGGGWGTVTKRNLEVAIKQFHPDILSATNIARLKREMEMLARIRHPNLVHFIGVVFEEHEDVTENPPYIITELLDRSLRAAYEQKQIPPENMCPIFQDTARALDYLHRRHEPIIHRDVSSANVLLKRLPNGCWMAKVSDLGSANLAKNALTRNEGALIYCAPEAKNDGHTPSGGFLTSKIDVYSYGIMLCEVATSTLPESSKFPSMLTRVSCEWPKLYHLITICIKQDPKQRPTMEKVLSVFTELP